jgi:hypothetical protein
LLEFDAEFKKVIDGPIKNDAYPAIRGTHRLSAHLAKIEYRETAVTQNG